VKGTQTEAELRCCPLVDVRKRRRASGTPRKFVTLPSTSTAAAAFALG
jgi:hypothetical protein